MTILIAADGYFSIFTLPERTFFMEENIHLLIMYTMLVLTLLLFHKGKNHHRSLILALYASVEVVTNGLNSLTLSAGWSFFDSYPFSHFIYKPIYTLWVPLFYFYYRSCLSSDFRITKKHWPHFLPAVIFFLFFFSIWGIFGNQYIWENLYKKQTFLYRIDYAVDISVNIQYLIYNILMIRSMLQVEQKRPNQKSESPNSELDFNWLRFIVYGYALGCLGGITIFISHLFENPAVEYLNIISISYFFLFFFAIFYNTITQKPYEKETKQKNQVVPDDEMKKLMEIVDEMVIGKKMFLVPELNLQQLSLTLNEKERTISQAINTIKKQNVNEYINSLRIQYACRMLLEDREKPVFKVMYDSGFSTKGAFNLVFKKFTGQTPTKYRETNQA